MELFILDEALQSVAIVDTFTSLIWTDRFHEYGDFEIYAPMNDALLKICKPNYYIYQKESDHVMIIESVQITSDMENGSKLTISGRSLESILERRIIWEQTILTGKLQEGIQLLLNRNVISPSIAQRKIPNFIVEPSTDPLITELTVDMQLMGENLYEVIKTICMEEDIGFRVRLSSSNEFIFSLYQGENRSYEQMKNPYVVFSPEFDNIITSNYLESTKMWKNVSLVGGEGEGYARKTAIATTKEGAFVTGLSRREIFTQGGGISSKVDGRTLTQEEYDTQLKQKGMDELGENIFLQTFEGQVETTRMYRYGEDFFMGDIVQFTNEYGMTATVRVTELVYSEGVTGAEIFPTFRRIEKKEEDVIS